MPGGGNHRGSIFRLHVGTALLTSGDWPEEARASRGSGNTAKGRLREDEYSVEVAVSQHIGSMPFLWIAVDDETTAWLERWSPKLHDLDRSTLYRIVGQLKLRADLRSPLAESTASKRITNVKTVLNEAVNEGVISQLDWPPRKTGAKRRSERPRKSVATTMRKKSVETPATLCAIIEASTNPKWISNRYRGMTAVAGLAGLRPSEVFYLDFGDLQLPDDDGVGQILVRDSDVRTEERWMIDEDAHEEGLVKTVESARVVPIPPRLVEELRRWIAIRGITSGPLFNTTESAKSWPDSLRLACSKAGVVPHSPYDLRRMYASHMVEAGYSYADVAARMGNTIEILIKHYVLPVKSESGVSDAKLIALYEGLDME